MNDDRPGEFELISRYFAPLATDPGSLHLTDDAAVLSPRPGYDLVVTKDVLAADVHFFADDAPEAIAAKALRANLSDLAAKGARARGYLLGLALPDDWKKDWIERFCNGLAADQASFDVPLLGGDTIRSGNGLQISITAIGEVSAGKTVRRSGARPGDVLFVSGTIGDSAAGLKARLDPEFCRKSFLTEDESRHILDRYLLPRPRSTLADPLSRYASAAMDVSDGLLSDCAHLAAASHVDLRLDLDLVPLSNALLKVRKNAPALFVECLNGGDDYEIIACVPPDLAADFCRAVEKLDVPLSKIGSAESGVGNVVVLRSGEAVEWDRSSGFRHF